jgi:two-component system phosphate regulon sensor histidine kinase PhoR
MAIRFAAGLLAQSLSSSLRWVRGASRVSSPGAAAKRRSGDFYAALLAMMSHDLRQPLQLVVSVHELLANLLPKGLEHDYLERSDEALMQLSEQLDRLLEAVRVEERVGRLASEAVEIAPLFERLHHEHADRARRKGLDFRIQPLRCAARSDPVLLEGILRNLVRNALNYTPAGGRVLLGCRRRGNALRIEVYDTGIGIASADVLNIFEAFHRCAPEGAGGLGLGLFIVKRAADSLGHKLEVRTVPGHGSRFTVMMHAADMRPLFTPSHSGQPARERAGIARRGWWLPMLAIRQSASGSALPIGRGKHQRLAQLDDLLDSIDIDHVDAGDALGTVLNLQPLRSSDHMVEAVQGDLEDVRLRIIGEAEQR